MKYKFTPVLALFLFSTLPRLLFTQNIVGTWNLTEGKYNNVVIPNLTAKLVITSVPASDSLNYLATFNNGTHSGTARARYTVQGNKFKSNLTGANLVLNGLSAAYINGPNGFQYAWVTSLSITLNVFNQWGGTAIGYGDPTFSVVGNVLTFTSPNGNAVLKYQREASPVTEVQNGFVFSGNYPNPVVHETRFPITLSKKARIQLSIHYLGGAEVARVADETLQPGEHSFTWRPDGAPPGIYLYRLVVDMDAVGGVLIVGR